MEAEKLRKEIAMKKRQEKINLWIRRITGIITGSALVLILAVSSVEIAAYSDFGFYEREYTKYNVNSPEGIVNMEMDELVRVTKEMMAYLRGDRKSVV